MESELKEKLQERRKTLEGIADDGTPNAGIDSQQSFEMLKEAKLVTNWSFTQSDAPTGSKVSLIRNLDSFIEDDTVRQERSIGKIGKIRSWIPEKSQDDSANAVHVLDLADNETTTGTGSALSGSRASHSGAGTTWASQSLPINGISNIESEHATVGAAHGHESSQTAVALGLGPKETSSSSLVSIPLSDGSQEGCDTGRHGVELRDAAIPSYASSQGLPLPTDALPANSADCCCRRCCSWLRAQTPQPLPRVRDPLLNA